MASVAKGGAVSRRGLVTTEGETLDELIRAGSSAGVSTLAVKGIKEDDDEDELANVIWGFEGVADDECWTGVGVRAVVSASCQTAQMSGVSKHNRRRCRDNADKEESRCMYCAT